MAIVGAYDDGDNIMVLTRASITGNLRKRRHVLLGLPARAFMQWQSQDKNLEYKDAQ